MQIEQLIATFIKVAEGTKVYDEIKGLAFQLNPMEGDELVGVASMHIVDKDGNELLRKINYKMPKESE